MDPKDQDYEWVACIQINAKNKFDALSWGDMLAKDYSKRRETEIFIRSDVLDKSDPFFKDVKDWDSTPIIEDGEYAADDKISW